MASVVLGIDPGSRNTGISVLRQDGNRYETLYCDVIKVGHLESHVDRLQSIYMQVTVLIERFSPDSCAVETPLYGKDPLALLKLGRAQAAAIMAAVNAGVNIEEYYPKMVKKSITGNGNASKEQVAYMLDRILGLNGQKFPADATDALAVAWCHLTRNNAPNREALKSSRKSHQNNARDNWSAFIAQNPDRLKSSDQG
ncbi:MAG: crossover junction endodeoxyribonuclease RuvC [Bacteroidetes bacterium HLUCCA01]|nr:MAG: crossover junction endodeoxyribonuclease RuvC [Bacteroidetes bacterium HLUCCA01]